MSISKKTYFFNIKTGETLDLENFQTVYPFKGDPLSSQTRKNPHMSSSKYNAFGNAAVLAGRRNPGNQSEKVGTGYQEWKQAKNNLGGGRGPDKTV